MHKFILLIESIGERKYNLVKLNEGKLPIQLISTPKLIESISPMLHGSKLNNSAQPCLSSRNLSYSKSKFWVNKIVDEDLSLTTE